MSLSNKQAFLWLLPLALLFSSQLSYSQHVVKGVIIDDTDDLSIPGANILVKNTTLVQRPIWMDSTQLLPRMVLTP